MIAKAESAAMAARDAMKRCRFVRGDDGSCPSKPRVKDAEALIAKDAMGK